MKNGLNFKNESMKNLYLLIALFPGAIALPLKAQDILFECGDLVESEICEATTNVLSDFFLSFEADRAEEVRLVYLADPPINQFAEFWRGRRAEQNLNKQRFFESLDRHKTEKLSEGWRWEVQYVHHHIFRQAGDLISAQFHSLGIIELIDANGISLGNYIVEIEGVVRSANDYQILSIKQGSIDDFSKSTGLELSYIQADIFHRDRRSSGMILGITAGASVLEMEHFDTDFSPNELLAGISFEWFPNNGNFGISAGARFHRADYEFSSGSFGVNSSSREDIQIADISNSLGESLNTNNQSWNYKVGSYQLESTQSLIAIPVSLNYRIFDNDQLSLIFGLHYTFQMRSINVHRESLNNSTIDLLVDGKSFNSGSYNDKLLPIVGDFGTLSLEDRVEAWTDQNHWIGAGISLRYKFGDHMAIGLNLSAEADLEALSGDPDDEFIFENLDYNVSGQSGKINFPLRSQYYNTRRYMIGFGIYYFL